MLASTGPALADPDVEFTVSVTATPDTTISPGQETTLVITLANSNTAFSIDSVDLTTQLPGTLPDGLVITGGTLSYSCYDPTSGNTISGSGTLTASPGSQAITLSGGSIPLHANGEDGSCTIGIPITAQTSDGSTATYTVFIDNTNVSGSKNGVTINPNGDASQSISVLSMARPTITKQFDNSPLTLGGGPTTLTITVTNPNGSTPITGFSIQDQFPSAGGNPIIEVASPPNAQSSCTNGGTAPSFNPSAGDTLLQASGGDLAPNGSCTLKVDVIGVQTDGNYRVSRDNTIDAATDFSNDLGIHAERNATDGITVRSPLHVRKRFIPSELAAGESGELRITWRNDGDSDLTVQSFTDSPIDGTGNGDPTRGLVVNNVSASCSGSGTAGDFVVIQKNGVDRGIQQDPSGTWTTIAAGESCTITVAFTAYTLTDHTPVAYTNTIPQGALDVGNPGIVSRRTSASILVADDLRIIKSILPPTPRPGNPVEYEVRVENWSAADMASVRIQDDLPGGLTFLTGTIDGFDYTPRVSPGAACGTLTTASATGDTTADITIATVPARSDPSNPGYCAVRFYAMVPLDAAAGLEAQNLLPAGSVCQNDGTGPCNGGDAQTHNAQVDATILAAAKSFAPAGPLPEGSVTTMTIQLTNHSVNDLTSLAVSDTLPSDNGVQMLVATPANASTTCGGSLTVGSHSVALNNGTIPAGGSCEIRVDVTGPAGSYTNQVDATALHTGADGTSTRTVNASATAGMIFSSVIGATKQFSPDSVASGGRSRVIVRLENSGSLTLDDIRVQDPLPTGMVVADPANAYTTCDGATSVTANPGDNSVLLNGARLPGGGSCDLVFEVSVSGSGPWINTIPPGGIEVVGTGVVNQAPVTATLGAGAPGIVTISKQTTPASLTFPGQLSRFTITLTNGVQPVTGLELTDYFTDDGTAGGTLNGWVVASNPQAFTDCPGGIVQVLPGGTRVGIENVSLAAGQSCSLSIDVSLNRNGSVINTIPVNAIVTDQGLSNPGQATTTLAAQVNLGLIKQFTPNVVQAGQRSRLKFTIINPSGEPATNLALTDQLPAGLSVPPGANPVTDCAGASFGAPQPDRITLSGGTLGPATGIIPATCSAEIDVVATSAGEYDNIVPAGNLTATVGGAPVGNTEPVDDLLRVRSPLVLHKAIDGMTLDPGNPGGFTTGSATRAPGATATLTIRLENPNNIPLTQTVLADHLPTGLVVAPAPAAGTDCAGGVVTALPSGTSVELSGATVPANGSCSLSVQVLSNTPGSYRNTIPGGSVGTTEGVSNGQATSAELIVTHPPTLGKAFQPAVIPAGGTSRLVITLDNANQAAMTLTGAFTDNLPAFPAQMTVASPPNASTSCGGSLTATAGATSVTLASGATIPAGGCRIEVDVTAPSGGTYANTIPAGALQTSFGSNGQPASTELIVNTLGYLSGKVFKDNSVTPDGIFNPGIDAPLTGVTIELYGGSSCSGTPLQTMVTDSQGNYLFHSLPAGTYTVCEPTQPAGTVDGITTAGGITTINGSTGTPGTASGVNSLPSRITGIVLGSNGAGTAVSGSTGNNFAEVVRSGIAGQVFLDHDNNGLPDGPDRGIAGQTILLFQGTPADCSGSPLASTVTDGQGRYRFDDLAPGTYSLCQPSQPTGTRNGLTLAGAVPNGGTPGTATGVDTLPSRITGILLPPNTVTTNNNFAEIPADRVVSGRIFLDFDNNGILDGPDYGLGGQPVELTGTDVNGNAVNRSVTTDGNGEYRFENLPEGTYRVTEPVQPPDTSNGQTLVGTTGGSATDPATTPSVISGIDLTGNNRVSAENNFAEIPSGGAPDLTLDKTHEPSSLGAGSSTGYFLITPGNLGPGNSSGTVTVTDNLPPGMVLAASPSGSDWSCSGNAGDTSFSCTSTQVVPANGSGSSIRVPVSIGSGLAGQVLTNTAHVSGGGELPGFTGNNSGTDVVAISGTARVSGTVWFDPDHNRVPDAGETRLPGWTVELLLNGIPVATTTTATDGTYAFENVSPGSGYRIQFRNPDTGQIWGRTVANEQGLTPVDGVRDNPTQSVTDNHGNPAGASLSSGTLDNLQLFSGDNILQQSLPVDPSGVIYNSVTRQPISGAGVTLVPSSCNAPFDPTVHLLGGAAAMTMTTDRNGYYQFTLTGSAPDCEYRLEVTAPGGYQTPPSGTIPPEPTPLSVPGGPGIHPVQPQPTAPGGTDSTTYYLVLQMGGGSQNVVNNHIPLDPQPVSVPTLGRWAQLMLTLMILLSMMGWYRRNTRSA